MQIEDILELTSCLGDFWQWKDEPEMAYWKERARREGGDLYLLPSEGSEEAFLQENWLECVRQCSHVAGAEGKRMWLFDDYLPSGHCNGSVGSVGAYRKKQLLCVRKVEEEDKVLRQISYRGAEYFICVRTEKERTKADVLNPEAVSVFLRNIQKEYKRACSRQMGEEIVGFITSSECEDKNERYALPWSDAIEECILKKKGYSITEQAEKLFFPIEGFHQVRFDYSEAIEDLWIQNFLEPYSLMCAEQDLKFGIRVLENIKGLCYGDMPVIFAEDENKKEVLSAGAQLGKENMLFVLNGTCASENKKQADTGLLMGASLFALDGEDEKLREYITRGVAATAPGEEANVLLLTSKGSERLESETEKGYYKQKQKSIEEMLFSEQISFHYGDEGLLYEMGRCENGRLIVGKRSYKTVIVPPGISLRGSTISLLEKTAHVILMAPYPYLVNGREAPYSLLDLAYRAENLEELRVALNEKYKERARAKGGNLCIRTAKSENGTWYFVLNRGEACKAEIFLPESRLPYLADLYDGEIYFAPAVAEGAGMKLKMELAKGASVLLYVPKESIEAEDYPAFLPGGIYLRPMEEVSYIENFTKTNGEVVFNLRGRNDENLCIEILGEKLGEVTLWKSNEEIGSLAWGPYVFSLKGTLCKEEDEIKVSFSSTEGQVEGIRILKYRS